VEEPLIAKSNQARDALLDVLTQAITSLHWKDFETLTDAPPNFIILHVWFSSGGSVSMHFV
jgi:hypothetical protein